MAGEQDKSIKDVENELAKSRERAKELEKKIEEAEAKHPPRVDHTEDGGVI
jgi:phage shock protein A